MNPSVLVYLALALCAFLTGLSKGGLGGGLGTLVTPILALVMPAPMAVGVSLPMLIIGDFFAVSAHWRGWNSRLIWMLLPGSILGIIVGSFALGRLSTVLVQHILGAAAILYTLYKFWSRWRAAKLAKGTGFSGFSFWQTSIFGSLSGVASTMANAAGPLITIYLLGWRLSPSVFVGTTALYFAIVNLLKVPGYLSAHILNQDMLLVIAWTVPIIPFGVWSGKLLDKHLNMDVFETVILVLLAATGVLLLLKSG